MASHEPTIKSSQEYTKGAASPEVKIGKKHDLDQEKMDNPYNTEPNRMDSGQSGQQDNNCSRSGSFGDGFYDRGVNYLQGQRRSSSEIYLERRKRLSTDHSSPSPVYARYRRRLASNPNNPVYKGPTQTLRKVSGSLEQQNQNDYNSNLNNLVQMSELSSSGVDLNNLSPGRTGDEVFAFGATRSVNGVHPITNAPWRSVTSFLDREALPGDSVSMHNGHSGVGPTHDDTASSTGSTTNIRNKTRQNLISLLSIIYASFIISLGTIFSLDPSGVTISGVVDQIFSSATCVIGIAWLVFLQVDIALYKRRIVRRIKEKLAELEEHNREAEKASMTTEVILETLEREEWQTEDDEVPRYRFQKGRHAGSFFLKTGMAAFCFGHLIYEGLILTKLITTSSTCHVGSLLPLHILRPMYSFYQLFMVFKYSHIIINHFTSWARFGVMHLIATSITSWLRTIILDAQVSHHKSNETNEVTLHTNHEGVDCRISPLDDLPLLSYLYPFTIEFSVIMAGVWYIIWMNIGNTSSRHASHAHLEARVSPIKIF